MLPARNEKDLEEISDDARRQLEFIFLEKIDDAIAAALEKAGGVSIEAA
jgi:ATP-dependent Lon protease